MAGLCHDVIETCLLRHDGGQFVFTDVNNLDHVTTKLSKKEFLRNLFFYQVFKLTVVPHYFVVFQSKTVPYFLPYT